MKHERISLRNEPTWVARQCTMVAKKDNPLTGQSWNPPGYVKKSKRTRPFFHPGWIMSARRRQKFWADTTYNLYTWKIISGGTVEVKSQINFIIIISYYIQNILNTVINTYLWLVLWFIIMTYLFTFQWFRS